MRKIKDKIYYLLRLTQKYTETDMVYLAKGGFWFGLNQIVSITGSFLLAIVFANLLPKEIFGTYRYVLSVTSILAISSLSGMHSAIIRAVARGYEGSFVPAIKTRLKWGLLGSLGSLLLAGYYFVNNNIILTIVFLIVAAFTPFLNSLNLYTAFFNGRKQFKKQNGYTIINNLFSTVILITTIFLTNNLFLIILAYFGSHSLIRFILLQITLRKTSLNKKQDPDTIAYGKHLSLMGVIETIANHLDKILVWHFLGGKEVAIYSFALILPDKIKNILGLITPLTLPKLSQKPKAELKATLPKKIFKFLLATILVVIIYIIAAPFLYKLFFPKYLGSILYSQILALTILYIPATLFETSLVAKMQTKKLYFLRTSLPLTRIALLLILTPLYGIWGIISATLILTIISFCLNFFFFKKM